jgi:predicted NAD/FAD-binding protein
LVSLNPIIEPDASRVIRTIDYAHPVFDLPAGLAQRRLSGIQGRNGVWLAGAWTGYGFHEDGLASGFAVAGAINQRADAFREAA